VKDFDASSRGAPRASSGGENSLGRGYPHRPSASQRRAREDRDASIERDLPACGVAKTQRVDLGLELLSIARTPDSMFTLQEIAMWCGCTRDAILIIERKALHKLRHKLQFGALRDITEEIAA